MAKETLISQAAEAIILRDDGRVIKRRIKKSYRIPEIDERLRTRRTKSEARIMEKLQGKINIPKIIRVDVSDFARQNRDKNNERGRELKAEIVMQYIEGKKLSEHLDNFPLSKQLAICKEIGKGVGKIHNENIIHGDLTTSNMILVENSLDKQLKQKKSIKQMPKVGRELFITNNKIFLIDFGLSFHSSRIEDKAVDLHLLRQALESKHFFHWEKLFKVIIDSYQTENKEKILKQLEKVEKRGRYKN